ncbi:MAG: DUF2513 domain-containing protein [Candidatus Neomarinimicrobiota bacterium]
MKRNMDLIREILLNPSKASDIKGYDIKTICFHVMLLEDAGFVRFGMLTEEGKLYAKVIEDEAVWNQAKELVLKKTGSLSFYGLLIALDKLRVT